MQQRLHVVEAAELTAAAAHSQAEAALLGEKTRSVQESELDETRRELLEARAAAIFPSSKQDAHLTRPGTKPRAKYETESRNFP